MANYRLGLDIGSNSIGWCAVEVDEEGRPSRVLKAGVRILTASDEAGRDPKSKASLAANRRAARAMRRRRDRFLRRQNRLMETLTDAGLMPESAERRKGLEALDPYWLRRAALDGPLEPYEIGRALFHLNQRRGFKSNRKVDSRNDERSATKEGIEALATQIGEAGARTLGEFLANRHRRDRRGRRLDENGREIKGESAPQPVRFRPASKGSKNVYDLYPTRELIKHEIDTIWKEQTKHHPDLLTDRLRARIERIVIEQRPLKEQYVGRCTLRPAEKIAIPYGFEIDMGERAPKAHPLFQRFRILQDVGHLRVSAPGRRERPLTIEERDAIAAALSQRSGATVSFDRLRGAARLPEDSRFNYELSGRKGLRPDMTAAKLASKNVFGPSFRRFDRDRRIEIVERLLAIEDESALCQWLEREFGVNVEAAERISDTPLPRISHTPLV